MNALKSVLRIILLLFAFSIFGFDGIAQDTVIITNSTGVLEIGERISIFQDDKNTLSYEDILLPEIQSRFKKSNTTFSNLGLTSTTVWCKIHIKNNSDKNIFLEGGEPTIDSVFMYYSIGNKNFVKKAGDHTPIEEREFRSNLSLFRLNLHQGESRTYYLRFRSQEALQFNIKAGSEDAFFSTMQKSNLIDGVYYGFILLIMLYNIFLFIAIRDSAYLFYVLFTVSISFAIAYIKGQDMIICGNFLETLRDYPAIVYTVSILISVAFSISFLQTSKNSPRGHKGLLILMAGYAVPGILNLSGFNLTAMLILELLVMFTSFYLYFLAIAIYKNGYKQALFYVWAWSAFLTGVVITVLKDIQFLPANFFTINAIQIGSSCEVLLLSFALADRINIYKAQKTKAQELALKASQEAASLILGQNKLLEAKVKERTSELEEKNQTLQKQQEELKELNLLKDKFFSILSHDIRGPLNSLLGIITLMKEREFTKEELNFFIGQLSSTLTTTRNFLDNILHWAISQIKEGHTTLTDVNLHVIAKETIEILKHTALSKKIEILNEFLEDFIATADINMLRLVMRNLVSNAIKFTPENGSIILRSTTSGDKVIIAIQDSGIGITKDNQEKLFSSKSNYSTVGTANEKGTGIGLILCKEFLAKNKEKIWVESEPGKGSTFKFTLSARHTETLIAEKENSSKIY